MEKVFWELYQLGNVDFLLEVINKISLIPQIRIPNIFGLWNKCLLTALTNYFDSKTQSANSIKNLLAYFSNAHFALDIDWDEFNILLSKIVVTEPVGVLSWITCVLFINRSGYTSLLSSKINSLALSAVPSILDTAAHPEWGSIRQQVANAIFARIDAEKAYHLVSDRKEAFGRYVVLNDCIDGLLSSTLEKSPGDAVRLLAAYFKTRNLPHDNDPVKQLELYLEMKNNDQMKRQYHSMIVHENKYSSVKNN